MPPTSQDVLLTQENRVPTTHAWCPARDCGKQQSHQVQLPGQWTCEGSGTEVAMVPLRRVCDQTSVSALVLALPALFPSNTL